MRVLLHLRPNYRLAGLMPCSPTVCALKLIYQSGTISPSWSKTTGNDTTDSSSYQEQTHLYVHPLGTIFLPPCHRFETYRMQSFDLSVWLCHVDPPLTPRHTHPQSSPSYSQTSVNRSSSQEHRSHSPNPDQTDGTISSIHWSSLGYWTLRVWELFSIITSYKGIGTSFSSFRACRISPHDVPLIRGRSLCEVVCVSSIC